MNFTYVILYVADIDRTIGFYEEVFALEPSYVHESGKYVEMQTGRTILGFAEEELARSLDLDFRETRVSAKPPGFEIGFTVPDVDAAFESAVTAGAVPVHEPKDMPWGQRVAYVRDIDGVLVVIATPPERRRRAGSE